MNILLVFLFCFALLTTTPLSASEGDPHNSSDDKTYTSEWNDELFEKIFAEYAKPDAEEKDTLEIFDTGESYLTEELVAHLLESCHERVRIIIERLKKSFSASKSIKSFLISDRLLLVGPPGVGKSDLAKAIAQALGRPFIFLKSSLIATEYQNSGSQNLKRIIDAAKKSNRPCVIILDEIYSLIDKKKNDQKADQDTAVALWQLIDECSQNKNILFIGTTNSLRDIPDALKSRFSNHIVEIDLPNETMRKNIVSFYAQETINDDLLKTVVTRTQGFSARELKELVCEMRASAAMRNEINPLHQDFTSAMQEMKRCKKLFEVPLQEKILEELKKNAFSAASISISLLSLCLPYLREIGVFKFTNSKITTQPAS